jgi:hypothetical protein
MPAALSAENEGGANSAPKAVFIFSLISEFDITPPEHKSGMPGYINPVEQFP